MNTADSAVFTFEISDLVISSSMSSINVWVRGGRPGMCYQSFDVHWLHVILETWLQKHGGFHPPAPCRAWFFHRHLYCTANSILLRPQAGLWELKVFLKAALCQFYQTQCFKEYFWLLVLFSLFYDQLWSRWKQSANKSFQGHFNWDARVQNFSLKTKCSREVMLDELK